MDGANQTSTSYFFGNGDNWQVAGVADFNGDGNADLLWRNQVDGRNAIVYLDKTAMIIYPRSFEALADTNWQIAGIGDFDNDGSPDLLWRNQLNGRNLIWYMERGASYIDAIAKKSSVEIEPLADINWQIAGIFQWFGEPEEDIPGSTKLTIASASRITADLTGLSANTNIQFLDSNGVVVKSISNGSGTEGQISSIFAPGTYYVVITGDNNSSNYPLQLQQEALPFGLQSSSLQVTDRDLSKPGINVDAGDYFGFNFSVTNNSESSITSPFDVGLYITSDPFYLNDPSNSNHVRKIGSYRMDALGWGETKEVNWTAGDIAGANWTFADGYSSSAMLPGIADDIWKWGDGNYYMAAIVDPDQELLATKTKTLEEGEDINQISVSGASLIDLQGAAFDPYNQLSAIARGTPFSIQFKVKNTGPTPAGSFRVGFYLSPTLPITTNAISLGSYVFADGLPGFSALNPAYNLMLTKNSLQIPTSVQPGTYYLGMFIDSLNANSGGQIAEINDSNRTSGGVWTVANNSSRGVGIDYKVVTVV
jgi:FG-GAP-like repeat